MAGFATGEQRWIGNLGNLRNTIRQEVIARVRVFNDAVAVDRMPPTDPDELALLLDAEDRAGRTDPYRLLGSQLHVIAARPPSP